MNKGDLVKALEGRLGSRKAATDALEAVLDVFIDRRVLSHWGPLLTPAREEQLLAALQEGRSSSVSRTRL